MKSALFCGCGTALVTPFRGARVDYDALENLIDWQLDSDVDALAVMAHGAKAVQLHTGGSCHMDARMTLEGLRALLPKLSEGKPKFVFLENIGNLVCPAEFDVGAQLKLVLLSAPEGDDKPLKYPLMFTVAQLIAVSKIDTAEVFGFSGERFEANVRALNKDVPILPICAKTGEGIEELEDKIRSIVKP